MVKFGYDSIFALRPVVRLKPEVLLSENTEDETIEIKNKATIHLDLSEKYGTITYPNTKTFTVTKNETGGKLRVSSSDESVATASINGTTVTIIPQVITVDGKKAIITVTSEATSNHAEQTVTYVATVNRGTITLSADAYTGTYDGVEHNAVSNVKVTPSDATVTYKLDSGSYSSTIPKVTAGEYTVSIKATKAGYVDKVITKTVTVNKLTMTLSADAYTGAYDSVEHNAVSNVKVTPSDATVTYKLDNGSYSSTIPKVTEPGTYTVSIKATRIGYEDCTIEKTVKILKVYEASDIASSTKWTNTIVDYLEYERQQSGASTNGTKSTTWEVLYADNNNIYLIMKYTTSNPEGDTNLSAGVKTNYTAGSEMLSDIDRNVTTQKRFPAVKAGWFSKWMDKYKTDSTWTSNLVNMQATMYMLDSNLWNSHVFGVTGTNTYGDWAIGGPTLELFARAYDKQNKTNCYDELKVNRCLDQYAISYGYELGSSILGEVDGVSKDCLNNRENYWISSPVYESYGVIFDMQTSPYSCVRPCSTLDMNERFPLRSLSKIWSQVNRKCDNRTL